jgi:hypothetical protein
MKDTEPNSEAKAAEVKPEAKAEPTPETKAKAPSELTPQIIQRVHELYEELGREEVRAVQEWEKAGREIRKDETKAEPKLEAKTAEPKPEAKAAETKPEVKAAETKPEAKAGEPKPEAKAAKRKFEARNKIIFTLSILGVLAALVAAYLFGRERKAQPPVFKPVSSPYESAIYANGIVESDQSSGENINIFPEVSGPITKVLVREGQSVLAGTPLFTIDDSVQRPTTEQLRLQSEASLALLEELKAQPRTETLAIAVSQVGLAESSLKVARDEYDKRRASFDIEPQSISKDVLDTAQDTVDQAVSALDVARKQYELTKAGAWSYDITNQAKQYEAQPGLQGS